MASESKRAEWFRELKATSHPDIGHGIPYRDTAWHKFEIQHAPAKQRIGHNEAAKQRNDISRDQDCVEFYV